MNKQFPKVFISYSHDSDSHMQWVARLAAMLREKGIDAVLDQWDLKLGDDIAKFMEDGLSGSDRVLLICTENYVRKSDAGKGGVGYEKMIVTAEIFRNLGTHKFIPVIKQKSVPPQLPKFLGPRLYIDLSNESNFYLQFEILLRELHNQPEIKKPPIGKNPFEVGSSGVGDYSRMHFDKEPAASKRKTSPLPSEVPDVKNVLREIIASLVDSPEEIKLVQIDGDVTSVIEIGVHPSDLSKVIGKQGNVARAIRTIVEDIGIKYGRRFNLEFREGF